MAVDPERLGVTEYRRRLADGASPFATVLAQDSARVAFSEASPLIGTAVHASSRIRDDLVPLVAASQEDRYREEDPETHRFLGLLAHTIVPRQSRFEVDLNRPPHQAVYETPEMAWGIRAYRRPLDDAILERSLEKWYEFHTAIDAAVEDAISRFGRAVVLDFHSYNYQREGPTDWRTDGKPVLNLGTKHLVLDKDGRALVDWFLAELAATTMDGEPVTVAENGVFGGGYLNRRLSRRFGPRCVTLSLEYKKVYMDESTGDRHEKVLADLVRQMDDTVQRLARRLDAPIRRERLVPSVV